MTDMRAHTPDCQTMRGVSVVCCNCQEMFWDYVRQGLPRWDCLKWRDIAVQIQRPVRPLTHLTCSRAALDCIGFFHVHRVDCKAPRSIRKTRVRQHDKTDRGPLVPGLTLNMGNTCNYQVF
jgi:hypothetical protein